ncbi:MAG TPA: hypothetical protein VLF67_02875 [Candidatus Saccharimonas sp.]|nr:hypothetical protein [Candidatus Saccharimonas sp.]
MQTPSGVIILALLAGVFTTLSIICLALHATGFGAGLAGGAVMMGLFSLIGLISAAADHIKAKSPTDTAH